MAFNADFDSAIGEGARHAQDDIAIIYLAIVERNLTALVNLAGCELGSASNAAAIFTAIGQVDALLAQTIEERTSGVHFVSLAALIGDSDSTPIAHSQMSLVQSPPG